MQIYLMVKANIDPAQVWHSCVMVAENREAAVHLTGFDKDHKRKLIKRLMDRDTAMSWMKPGRMCVLSDYAIWTIESAYTSRMRLVSACLRRLGCERTG